MSALAVARFNIIWRCRYVWERQLFYGRIIKRDRTQGEFAWIWTWRLDKLLQRIAEGPNG